MASIPSNGTEITWIGVNSRDFFDGANWAGGIVPGATDDVIIDGSSPAFWPDLTNSALINSLTITGSGQLEISGGTLTVIGNTSVVAGAIQILPGGAALFNTLVIHETGSVLNFGTASVGGSVSSSAPLGGYCKTTMI